MDTLLILRDTITAHAVKVIDTCQPCIHEADTNWKDVTIVVFICLMLIIGISIVVYGYYKSLKIKYCYLQNLDEHKYNQEVIKTIANADSNTKKTEKSLKEKFLSFCEDRKDVREDKDFVDYCVKKYKSLMDELLSVKEDR